MSTTNFDIYTILNAMGALGYDKNNSPLYLNDRVSWTDKYGKKRTGRLIATTSRWYPKKVRLKYSVRRDFEKDHYGYVMVVVFSKLSSLERIFEAQRV